MKAIERYRKGITNIAKQLVGLMEEPTSIVGFLISRMRRDELRNT